MNPSILAALFASSVALTSTHVEAQAPDALLGKWTIEFERGRRMENGEATIMMGTGKVTITQSGDSLLATFDMGPRPDGTSAPPSTVGGRMMPAGAVFVQKQTVEVNMNGDVQTREITLTWTLQANGDVLTGNLGRALPMRDEPLPPSPVKGKRIAGSSN
jgi:hypothetical protein